MTNILMVCLGNICRSPLAHGLLENKLSSDKFYIDSAGTAAYHVGEQPDPRSIAVAEKHGITINNQSARQFCVEDFDRFDIIYAMDTSNYNNILKLSRNQRDANKVFIILAENPDIALTDVPDPYYGGASGFDNVFDMLNSTCNVIAEKLK